MSTGLRFLTVLVLLLAAAGCGDDGTSPPVEPVTWIRGRVHTAPDSRPGIVTVERWGTRNPTVRATLDIDGKFAIPVPEGVYSVRLEMPDVSSYYVRRDGTIGDRPDSVLAITGTEADLDIQLGSALITLDFPEGYGNDQVRLVVEHPSLRVDADYRWDRAADRETFRIAHLPPGEYEYTLRLGFGYPEIRLARDSRPADSLEIVAGSELYYDAVLPTPAWIEFLVSDPEAYIDVYVESHTDGDQWLAHALVGEGSNRVPFVGNEVFVWADLGPRRFIGPSGTSSEPILLQLDPEEALQLPVEVARLSVEPLDRWVRLVLFDEQGRNVGQVGLGRNPVLWPGRYFVRIEPNTVYASDFGVGHWAGGVTRMSESEPVDLRSGPAQLTWEPVEGGTLRGNLATPQSGNLALRLTPVWDTAARYSTQSTLEEDRHFEVTRAPVGEFYLSIYRPFQTELYFPGVSSLDSATVLTIDPGAEILGLDWIR